MRTLLFLSLAFLCKSNPLRILNDLELLFGNPEITSSGQINQKEGDKDETTQGNFLKLKNIISIKTCRDSISVFHQLG